MTVTYTVGPGKTYSSIFAALAALPGGTFTDTQQIDVYFQSGGYNETNGLVISGYGSTSSFPLVINAVNPFNGTPGANVYVFDSNNAGTFRIGATQGNVQFKGLEIRGGSNNSIQFNGNGTGLIVDSCYLPASGAPILFNNSVAFTLINTIAYATSGRPWDSRFTGGATVKTSIVASGSTDFTVLAGSECSFTDCYAFGASNQDWWTGGPGSGIGAIGGDYNAGADTSSSQFTHNVQSAASSSCVTAVATTWTQAGGSNPLLNAGVFISGITTDIFGNARPGSSPWDIGPWQHVAGGSVAGDVAWTEVQDTWAAAGRTGVFAAGAWTEVQDSLASSATVTTSGTAAWTEVQDSLAASGTITSGVTGSGAWTEGNDSIAAAGSVNVAGNAAWTETQDSFAATGTLGVFAAAAWTEIQDAIAAAGTVSLPTITGSAAWTEIQDRWAVDASNGQIDTHDPGLRKRLKDAEERRKRKFEKERQEQERRRAKIVEAFERIIEGRPEITEEFADEVVAKVEAQQAKLPKPETFDFNALINSTERIQALWQEYLDRDDEEVLTLL